MDIWNQTLLIAYDQVRQHEDVDDALYKGKIP